MPSHRSYFPGYYDFLISQHLLLSPEAESACLEDAASARYFCWVWVSRVHRPWRMSATVVPVNAGSLWVVHGTETSTLADVDHWGTIPVTGVECHLACLRLGSYDWQL